MLRLKLVEITSSKVVYNYYPENYVSYGTIVIDITNGEVLSVTIAKDDTFEIYMNHAISKVEEFVKNNDYPEEQTVAWY